MDLMGNIFLAMGGLGLLLFGIKMVSTGLEVIAGDQLQVILKRATSNRFLAAMVGVIATIVINSSTAVSVITVGFVNAGLMNLTQAIGVLLGINVGTTFSAQLIAFRIDAYAPIFMFVGVVMYLFFKKRSIRNIGYAMLGFGILFFSITVMSDALRVFRTHPAFLDMITAISNPIFALLAGFIFTVIVQSSSATMGLLVTMHLSGVPIPFQTSAFIIFGANIGTSITAVIASIPASRDSKRTALFHITYDIIGSIVFGSLILIVPGILIWFQSTWAESARQVAMFHTLYNVATLLLLIPFVTLLAKLMQKVIPVRLDESSKMHERKLIYLDNQTLKTPTLAVVNTHLEICRMGKIANENLSLALEAFFEKNADKTNKVFENEKTVNFLHQNITAKLVEITNMPLSASDAKKIGDMFVTLSDMEQISDHAENIAEYVIAVSENDIKFSDTAIEELQTISKVTMELMDKALSAYEKQDKSKMPQIKELEDRIDEMSAKFAKNHFKRLKAKDCKPKSGVVFMDIINDLEKSADNAEKIMLSMAL
ncbi:MAG: Na/Pi cotransporter family protein [Defluviitaleaceae bacterium]|nr:Na/Pi cotransporter family protein [Defluviitaleaceae bacterium]